MSAPSGGPFVPVARSIPVITVDRRLARAIVATLVIGGYTGLGFAFELSAEGTYSLGSRSPSRSRCWSPDGPFGRCGVVARHR
jgi:hypothetical protein